MLDSLNIRNIALIDSLELELKAGLNILSGETGAGKSIIIDSLNFVLGERADRSLISYGSDTASVEAVFSDIGEKAERYLDEIGVETEEILIIRRKMTADGKNECRVNGKTVTLSSLRGLTALLVDIHGQHEHQSLLSPASHLPLLDSIGFERVASAAVDTAAAYKQYRLIRREKERFGDSEERARKLDILSFQINEIERADIKEGEEDELLEKRHKIRNMEKILTAVKGSADTLDGEDGGSVGAKIKNASSALRSVCGFDENIEKLVERLDAAKTEIEDISSTLCELLDELDYDSKTADGVEERLEIVRSVQRKYGGSAQAVCEFLEKAKAEADLLENADEAVARLEREEKKAAGALLSSAAALSGLRLKTAEKFEKDILKELSDLGMGGTTFKIQIESAEKVEEIGENGADTVEFLISPNVGEPLKPLAKIISGGEMSRFMLALKNIIAGIDGVGTMVFDEIDTGISGHIAAVVAEKLCNISRDRQVIAVTHMPSLASMADFHYLIEKSTEYGRTRTRVRLLDDDTDELARLIGGSDYSAHAVPHAKEMKAWANKYKDMIK